MCILDNKKDLVFDPMTLYNTVGAEVEYILEIHGKDRECLLKELSWGDFTSKKNLNHKERIAISRYLDFGDSFVDFLKRWEEDYLKIECSAKQSINKSHQVVDIFKDCLEMFPESSESIDVVDDILKFFGVDSEDELL